MQAGELFVSLGVKGTDKTVAAFASIKQGLGQTASMAFETKAAIVGAAYAIEQMTSASGNNAQGLINLSTVLGTTTEQLQRYRYAASLAGISNEQMDSSFSSLQKTLAEYKMTGQAPAALSRVAGIIGDKGFLEAAQKQDFPKVIQYLQKFAQSGISKDIIAASLGGLGLGSLTPGLMRGMFDDKNLARAPITGQRTLESLDKMKQRFTDIEAHANRMRDNMVVKWGPQLATDIDKILPSIEKLVDAFAKLETSAHAMQWIGKIFEGWGKIFDNAAELIQSFTNPEKMKSIKEGFEALSKHGLSKDVLSRTFFNGDSKNGSTTLNQNNTANFNGPANPKDMDHFAHSNAKAAHKVLNKNVQKHNKTSPAQNQSN